jgi:predicted permease
MEGFSHGPLSYPDEQDLARDATGVFSAVGGAQLALLPAEGDGGVEMLAAEGVTGSYFPMTGVRPAVGRLLGEHDDVARGAHPVVVLGWGFWQRRYAGDPAVVGRAIRLAGQEYTIVGVVEREYTGQIRGVAPDIYFPILMYEALEQGEGVLDGRDNHGFFTKARLARGVTLEQAGAALAALATSYEERYPDEWDVIDHFALVPTEDVIMNPMIDRVLVPAIAMVMAVVGLVLLIACANLASFLLARAADRRREIAMRMALGARRRSLVLQLLTETILLSMIGGAAGVLLARWSLRALTTADLPLPFPITLDLAVDGRVLAFTAAVSLAAGILFGLAPALQGTRQDVSSTLRDESAGGGRARGTVLRNTLVAAQVAVCVVLLTTAGLFLRSLDASRKVDPGFGHEPAGILTVGLPQTRYTDEELRVFLDELEARIAALPGVRSVGYTGNMHLNTLNTSFARVGVDGVEPPEGQPYHQVDNATIAEGFLDAVGIPLLEGRDFARTDVPGGDEVVIVNEAFVRRFFPDAARGDLRRALGRVVHLADTDARVVGVVATAKIRQLGEEPRPFLYRNHHQTPSRTVTLVARTSGGADRTARDMLRAARALDRDALVTESTTMERHLSIMLLPRRLGALLVAGFAFLALVLASIGLYGVVSYAVARRVREVGIRLSLGADARSVVWMLASDGMRLVAIGAAVGMAVSAVLAQLLSRLLFGLPALDPVTFAGVPILLGCVALLAAWIPARRASRVHPADALRTD